MKRQRALAVLARAALAAGLLAPAVASTAVADGLVRVDDTAPPGEAGASGGVIASAEPGRSDPVDDIELALRVQARFAADAQLKALQLRAEAARGIVQISGVAPGAIERRVAEIVARQVPGVREVINRIAVFG